MPGILQDVLLGLSVAIRVEVFPYHGVKNPAVSINPGPLGQRVRGYPGGIFRGEFFTAGLNDPGSIILTQFQRFDTCYLSVTDINVNRSACSAVGKNLLILFGSGHINLLLFIRVTS